MVGLLGLDTGTWSTMSVSKKHFVASAAVIRDLDLSLDDKALVADQLGKMFYTFNTNFDLARFFEAATGFTYEDYQAASLNSTTPEEED